MSRLSRYIEILREIQKRSWVKVFIWLWAAMSIYDVAVSQLVPHEFAKDLPKTWQVAIMTGSIFPIWVWLIVLAAILVIASFEYALRVSSPTKEPTTKTIEVAQAGPAFISMQEAATRLYESQAKVAGVRLAVAAERLGNLTLGAASPNERLEYLAHFISRKIDVFGCKPPSRAVGKIDPAEVKRASFRDGATVLRDNMYDKSIYWADLCVRADHVNDLIQSLTENGSAQHNEESVFEKAFYRASMLSGSRDDAKLLLAKLRGEGIAIRNHPQAVTYMFTKELDSWVARITEWMNEVIEAVKTFDAADAEWFRSLGEVPNARVGIPNIRLDGKGDRDRYIKAFREHDFRLARLDKLFSKYGIGG